MTPDFDRIADQLERFASLLRSNGREAWRNARDWQSPLKSSEGVGSGGGVSRPTETAALQRLEGHDREAEQFALFRLEVDGCYGLARDGAARILKLVGNALPENERAGIGRCDCGRYCAGEKNDRLRAGLCPACEVKHRRAKAG